MALLLLLPRFRVVGICYEVCVHALSLELHGAANTCLVDTYLASYVMLTSSDRLGRIRLPPGLSQAAPHSAEHAYLLIDVRYQQCTFTGTCFFVFDTG